MAVDLPSAFNSHTANHNSDPLRVGNVGSTSNLSVKANGGISINNDAQGWQTNIVGNYGGFKYKFVSSNAGQDFTSSEELFVIAAQTNAPNRIQIDTVANDGLSVRMYTNDSTDYRVFTVGGKDSAFGKFRAAPTAFLVDPQAAGSFDSGTYDDTSVKRYSFQGKRFNQAGSNTGWFYVSESTMIGTKKSATNTPRLHGTGVKLGDLPLAVHGTDQDDIVHVYCATLSDGIYFVGCPFVIGNLSTGNSVTTFDDEGGSFISPGDATAGDPRYHLTNTSMRVYLDLRDNAADTATFSGTYTWGTEAPWDFSQSDAATVTLDSASFNGMGNFTLGTSVSGSATWSLGGTSKVINAGADISGTVNGDMEITEAVDLDGLTINGNLVLNMSADATITLSNFKVTGTLTNSNSASTTITLATDPTVTLPTPGAGITITAANRSLILTGLVTNSEVRIYDTGTTTEVDGVENSGTSETFSINVSAVDVVVHHLDYENIKLTNVNTTANTTFPIAQQFDRQYNNP